jgi:glyoxylase-like metal-dependent hydrolase (beta-lactamase superfamily II)
MKKIVFLLVIAVAVGARAQSAGGIFSFQTGDYRICLLSEGQQEGGTGILVGATPEMVAQAIPSGKFPNAVNAFLIRTPERNILVDAGFGRLLFNHLDSLGVDPAAISDILLTHMHGDHIGGLLKEGAACFPEAKLYVSRAEYDYWMGSNNPQAIKVLAAYKDRLVLFSPNDLTQVKAALLPGIFPIATYGHTPGHVSFLVQSGDDKLLIWGDLAHAMAIQMPYPEVAVSYDVNPADAVRSRQAILKYVSENKIPIAGMHIAYPGMGTVMSAQGGYVFAPALKNETSTFIP